MNHSLVFVIFFFNDTATTEIYTLSLHDALPIYDDGRRQGAADIDVLRRQVDFMTQAFEPEIGRAHGLNSSHQKISYAVFCLKKKKRERWAIESKKNRRMEVGMERA